MLTYNARRFPFPLPSYVEVFKASFWSATCFVALLAFMDRPHHFGLMCFACGAVGFCAFAALPVGLELSVESTFPVNESLSAGLIWIWSQVSLTRRKQTGRKGREKERESKERERGRVKRERFEGKREHKKIEKGRG